jgi:hypothetical protein
MAKREINRQVEETEPVAVKEQEVALPAEKQARPKETKPLDVTITVKAPGIFVMRVWNGMVLFPEKRKLSKIPIVPGKPVTVRVTQ